MLSFLVNKFIKLKFDRINEKEAGIKKIFLNSPSYHLQFIIVVILSILLMAVDIGLPNTQYIKKRLTFLVSPIIYAVDLPFETYRTLHSYFSFKKKLILENEKLKQENLLFMAKLQKLEILEEENKNLKILFDSYEDNKEEMIITKIIKVATDPFAHLLILNKGEKEGAYIGQTVIDAHGIMGSIIDLDKYTSNLLLITDPSSAIPVKNLRNGLRSIAIGTGAIDQIELQHILTTADIEEDDIFVTSGLGGKFPSGYPIGKVISINKNTGKPFVQVILKPFANLDSSDIVLMINPLKTPSKAEKKENMQI